MKMAAETVQDVMTSNPRTVLSTASAEEAAQQMRECDCGSVIVTDEEGQVNGIVTDRDIVIRAVAEGFDPADCPVGQICSQELEVLGPDDTIDTAIDKMRAKAIKRLPVVEENTPVGIVALGDLAVERDPKSALGAISSAQANH